MRSVKKLIGLAPNSTLSSFLADFSRMTKKHIFPHLSKVLNVLGQTWRFAMTLDLAHTLYEVLPRDEAA